MPANRLIPALLLLLCGSLLNAATVREPVVAGTFYPAGPAELRQLVTSHLADVTDLPEIDGDIVALIVPHAGLVYSGQIAAYGYKLLENSGVNKVVLCGPSHRYGFHGISVYGPQVEWRTPLGTVACADDLCNQLLAYDTRLSVLPQAHQQEHCLEVQLPYLQTVLGDFQIAPALMGYQESTTIELMAGALISLPPDENLVLVASTDWQHYHSAREGWKLDSLGLECIKNQDPERLEQYLAEGKVEMCGGAAAVAVMKAARARGADRVQVLKYGDSGDVSGDKSAVVGYVAAVFYRANRGDNDKMPDDETTPAPEASLPDRFELTADERQTLLYIARESIKRHLADEQLPQFEVSDKLKQPGAGFVTLEKHEQLRGCIGYTEAFMPLYQAISDCAVKAAVSDYRFPPVKTDELDTLHIEISVLTPLQRVNSLDEIEVGRDGLMIFRGRNRGLLLPQVATDYEWDRTTFLEQTCRKAGLAPDDYQLPDTRIFKFQAVIFGE